MCIDFKEPRGDSTLGPNLRRSPHAGRTTRNLLTDYGLWGVDRTWQSLSCPKGDAKI